MGARQRLQVAQRRIPSWLINGIGVLVLLLYGLVFFKAATTTTPATFQDVLTYFLTTVNGMLAANLGALVGVTVAAALWHQSEPPASWFQIVAAVVYALFVVLAWAFWWDAGLTEEPSEIVAAIPEMCRTGLGILLGIFTLALGVKRPSSVRQDPST